MDTLDSPTELTYNNGKNFPPNVVMTGYVILVASPIVAFTGSYIFGAILLIVALIVVTNRHFVVINSEQNFIHDYSLTLGFIKVGKKYPLQKYKYITTMPLIESQKTYANATNSNVTSKSYTTVTFFGERLKGKRIIAKFDSKNEAEEIAGKLGERLNLKYFEYDPKLVRDILLGNKSI